MAEEAKAKGRKKKGEGPVTFMFLDTENKEHARVPSNVDGVKVTAKDGKSQTFKVGTLAPAILQQMAADALKRKFDMAIRSGYSAEKNNVISLATESFENIKSGKLFVRAASGTGGKGAGRTFDAGYWVGVTERYAKLLSDRDPKKNKPASKAQLEALKTKLEASTTQQRDDWKKKNLKNAAFALAKKQIDAEKAATKAGTAEAMDAFSL
jgi:hypothetical protein